MEDRLTEIMALERKERETALLEFAKELGCAPMRIYGENADLWKDGEGELVREDAVIRKIREAASGGREIAGEKQATKRRLVTIIAVISLVIAVALGVLALILGS